MKDERIVWRQRNVISTNRRYANPLFPRPNQRAVRRQQFGGWIALLLVLSAAVWILLLTLPAFRIAYVLVEGERYTGLGHSERVLQEYMQRKRFWVLPQQNYFVFSTAAARAAIERSLKGNQALAGLRITKHFPMTVTVQLTERIPHLLYVNGGKYFLADRQGVVATQVPSSEQEKVKARFPTFFDQTTRPVVPGTRVLDETYVTFLFDLQESLQDNTDIPVVSFYAPAVVCPQSEPQAPANMNRATNSTNGTAPAIPPKNANGATPVRAASTNGAVIAKVDQQEDESERGVVPTCNLQTMVTAQRELFVKTTEGWDLYFRSDDTVRDQLTRLVRTLRELRLDRTTLQYIDLRFGEHVVYKEKGR